VFLQFTFKTLYDPAKSALIPSLVRPDQLHVAAAVDSIVFALTASAGASAVSHAAHPTGTRTAEGANSCCY
jgi:hypothetical protein